MKHRRIRYVDAIHAPVVQLDSIELIVLVQTREHVLPAVSVALDCMSMMYAMESWIQRVVPVCHVKQENTRVVALDLHRVFVVPVVLLGSITPDAPVIILMSVPTALYVMGVIITMDAQGVHLVVALVAPHVHQGITDLGVLGPVQVNVQTACSCHALLGFTGLGVLEIAKVIVYPVQTVLLGITELDVDK